MGGLRNMIRALRVPRHLRPAMRVSEPPTKSIEVVPKPADPQCPNCLDGKRVLPTQTGFICRRCGTEWT